MRLDESEELLPFIVHVGYKWSCLRLKKIPHFRIYSSFKCMDISLEALAFNQPVGSNDKLIQEENRGSSLNFLLLV